MTGTVATFYSFKGGVGRTFALANVAVILSQWGFRVLAIDWDIEAPGLDEYFESRSSMPQFGLIDLIHHFKEDKSYEMDQYIGRVDIPDCKGDLHWIPAAGIGKDTDYQRAVQELDWDSLFSKHDFGNKIEKVRAEWVARYDFVLIDSRTGITDFSGLTTAQLPDILLVMFTANHQSLKGCCDLARRAMSLRQRLPIERAALLTVPISARFELREEYEHARRWRSTILEEVSTLLSDWMPVGANAARLLDSITIPYVPRWTFGAELACVQELADSSGVRSSSYQASYVLETLASLLAHRMDRISLLESGRDEFVRSGLELGLAQLKKRTSTAEGTSVFLSYNHADSLVADQIRRLFEQRGINVWVDTQTIKPGDSIAERVSEGIASADAMVVLLGRHSSRWVQYELDLFLRARLRGSEPKPLCPIVLKGGEGLLARTRMSEFDALYLDHHSGVEEQLEPVFEKLKATRPDKLTEFASYWRSDELSEVKEESDWTLSLLRQSISAVMQGRPSSAMSMFNRVVNGDDEIDWNTEVVAATIKLAQALFSNGEQLNAENVLEHALVFARKNPNPIQFQEAYFLLGSIRQMRGDLASATEALELSLSFTHRESASRARICSNLGHALMSQGRFQEALRYFEEALETDKRFADSESIGKSALALAGLLKLVSESNRALEAYRLAVSVYEKLEPGPGLGRSLMGVSDILRDLNHPREASEMATRAFELFRHLELDREANEARERI